jgi:hypothetical protein
MSWDRESSHSWSEHRHHDWHGHHHHGGNWWIAPLVIIGLIVLTHGWILIVPLVAIAAFAFFGFILPKMAWHMNNGGWSHQGGWNRGDWGRGGWNSERWNEMKQQRMQEWGEKRKHHFQNWGGEAPFWGESKAKRKNDDDIEYV